MKKDTHIERKEALQGYLSVLPALLIILAIKGYPMVLGFIKSFTNWNGMKVSDFVGMQNYISILGGSQFWSLITNNLILMLFIPVQLFVGLVIAVLLYEEVLGWKVFRSLYYLPQIISSVVTGYLFTVFFSYDGPINSFLKIMKLDRFAIEWLGTRSTGLIIIIICLVWINIGWQGMIVLGGMSSISTSIFEAARIDGAGYWRRLFYITIPMLVRTIEYTCIISVTWVLTGLFPFIFSMTKGGPGYDTTTVDYMIYIKSFGTSSEMGYACALAMILMVIVMAFTVVQMKISNRMDDWGE